MHATSSRLRTPFGWLAIATLVAVAACARRPEPVPRGAPPPPEPRMRFEATAYSIEGRTAAGTPSREGIVAADPNVLPLGTRIRVHGAGTRSGEYVVRDTGAAVKGREIDVYVADDGEAKRFGRKSVEVEVLKYGDGRPVTKQ